VGNAHTAIMLDDRGPELQAIFISLLILCILTVALRCYTMKFIVKRFEIEDWLAVATLVRPRDPVSYPTSPQITAIELSSLLFLIV
jgi:hypothetical protein